MTADSSAAFARLAEKETGVALILVLWILALMMIMAASFSLTMRRETAVIGGISSGAQAAAAAESGIAVAKMMLLNPDQLKRWRTDGDIYQIRFLDAAVRVRLLSETGKIDINHADQVQLQMLFARLPIDPEQQTALVSAIMDWRDPDDLVNINGAEKDEYREAGKHYQPRNKPFQSMEELQMVLGMNDSILKLLEPYITIYSQNPQIDLSQASREMMLIMGVDPALAEECIELRRQSASDGTTVPPFDLGDGVNCSSGQSNVVEIIAESLLNGETGAIIKTIVAVNPEAGGEPFNTLSWKQQEKASTSLFAGEMDKLLVTQNAGS